MTCIPVREGESRVIIYKLDGCGAPLEGAANKLVFRAAEVGYEDAITDGDEVNETDFGGRSLYSAVGRDKINNIGVNVTLGSMVPSFDVFTMGAAEKTSGGEVLGYGRTDIESAAGVAVEFLIQIDADACTEGATASPIAGWFFPRVKNWKPNAGTTLNGTDLLKPAYTAKGFKNASIFDGSPTDTDFAKWASIHDAGDEWYTFYAFDGGSYTLPEPTCEPTVFT